MRVFVLSLLVAPVVASCAPSAAPLSEEDRRVVVEQVTQAIGQLREAMNAHDAERVLSFYELGPEFVYVSCTELFLGTRYRTVASLYFRPSRGVVFEQELIQVRVLGPDAAVATLRGSSDRAPHLLWTQVWRRDADRGWIIAQAHQSWPDCLEPPNPHPGTDGREPADPLH